MARALNLDGIVREGVYTMVGGPNYETVAELKMLRELGVDAVGMSTIPETIVAHHAGMKVFACSLITNMCVVEYNTGIDTNHEEVLSPACLVKMDFFDIFNIEEICQKLYFPPSSPETPIHWTVAVDY